MAKKKQSSDRENQELDQAFYDLTGYKSKPKKSLGSIPVTILCLLAIFLAGFTLGSVFLLNENTQPTTLSTEPTAPNTSENTTEPPSSDETTEPYSSEETTLPLAPVPEDTVVLGIDLSGMTRQEASEALSAALDTVMTVYINGEGYPVSYLDNVASFDTDGAAAALCTDPQQFRLSDWLIPDTDAIRDIAEAYAVLFQQPGVPTTYEILGKMPTLEPVGLEPECQTLVITKGTSGTSLDNELLYQAILQGLGSGALSVEGPAVADSPDVFDLSAVYDACRVPAEDAVMDMESFHVSGGTYGYEFDLAAAQAKLDAAASGDVVEIPFYRIPPEISAQSLQSLLFRDVLASCSTPHTYEYNRNVNLKLACQAINGVILYPGQEFSYNAALGERTTEKGYLPAASYMGEETVDTVGGGICQVSSTLYYCTLLADLQVTYRAYHGFAVSYLPLGMDGMVSWGAYDYCFRNDSRYPLRIDAWVADGYVHIQLVGTDERTYYVEMENYVEATFPYETVYREMPRDNPDGYVDGDVIVTPYTGYIVHTYRCRYDRETGQLLSRDYEDYSEYWSRDEVIVKIVDEEEPPVEEELPPTEEEQPSTPPPEEAP